MSDAAPQTLAEGRHLRLVRRDGWEWVERRRTSGIVAILACTPEDRLLLVEQFRPPVGGRVLEIPAGLAGDIAGHEDEELATAAARELVEETGYEAQHLELLAAGPISAGLCTEIVSFFLGQGLRKVGAGGGDASESIDVHEVPRRQVPDYLRQRQATGVLVDPKVYAGLYLAGL